MKINVLKAQEAKVIHKGFFKRFLSDGLSNTAFKLADPLEFGPF